VKEKEQSQQVTGKVKVITHSGVVGKKPWQDYHLIFLWTVIIIVSIIRYRLIDVPFERDEGEYGYIGNLFLHGVAPFKDAYTMKLPGTSFMYAIFMLIFGHTNSGVHLGFLLINAATMYFLYAAFKQLFTPFISLATATIYGFMALAIGFYGFAAHATHFICFYSSIALLFLSGFMKTGKTRKIFLFGLMFGMAFLMKQQAVFFILFGVVFLYWYLKTEKKESLREVTKKLLLFGSGVFIPYSTVVLITLVTGNFHIFWLWTVDYASTYEAVKSFQLILLYFKSTFLPAWDEYYYVWILALGGILALLQSGLTKSGKYLALLYLIASICSLSSGFYFRPHYFIVILPVIGLLTGLCIEFIVMKLSTRMNMLKSPNAGLVILLLIVLVTIYNNRKYYFSYPPNAVCSLAYWGFPFTEAPGIAKYISENTNDTDKIAILGSEPEICFYAKRKSASSYIYTYPLVENQPYNEVMQEEMIKEVENAKPAYFIFFNIYNSWLMNAGTPKTIFEWVNKYTRDYYTTVGIDNFYYTRGWQFHSIGDTNANIDQPTSSIIILKRNIYSK
jgi:hypothetical protein